MSYTGNEIANRLKQARIEAGYDTAVEFARQAQVPITTYQHHENGRRGLSDEVAKRYARLLKLPPGTLLFGERLHASAAARLTGHCDGDGYVTLIDDADPTLIDRRDADQLLALDVTGMDMVPRYFPGDRLYYPALKPGRYRLEQLHNVYCVVELRDHRLRVAQIVVQANGRATLVTPRGVTLRDQQIIAASPIVSCDPYLPPHLLPV